MVCSHKANKPCFMLSGIPIPAPLVILSPVTCCRINHIIVINLYKDYRLSKLLPVDCFWKRRKCITINFKCFGTFSILINFSLMGYSSLLSAFCLFLLIFLFILIWNFSLFFTFWFHLTLNFNAFSSILAITFEQHRQHKLSPWWQNTERRWKAIGRERTIIRFSPLDDPF